MNNRKKLILCGVVAAVVLVVGVTMALLSATTGTRTNTFSSNKNISIQLREPNWDGYDWTDNAGDGTTAKYPNNYNLGVNIAKAYYPGQDIPKDPMIRNNGTGDDAVDTYVAIKLVYSIDADGAGTTYGYENCSYADFESKLLKTNGIVFNSEWTKIKEDGTNGQIWMYGAGDTTASTGTVLPKGNDSASTTSALFSSVPISSSLPTYKDSNGKDTGLYPSFKITVTGYAIQSANISADQAATQLLKFIGSN